MVNAKLESPRQDDSNGGFIVIYHIVKSLK